MCKQTKRNETGSRKKTSRVEEGRRRNTETGGRPRRSDAAEDGEAKKEEKKEEKKCSLSRVCVCARRKGKRRLGADNKNNTRECVSACECVRYEMRGAAAMST